MFVLTERMMNKKTIAVVLLFFACTLQPACKHEKIDGKQIYLRYLKSRTKNPL